MVWSSILRHQAESPVQVSESKSAGRCAIYTRKSSDEGLDQSFNSLHAQREACEAYVLSQKHEGWQALSTDYDDGGFSGGNMERPGLKKLLADITAGKIDIVVVYKVDRLTRSLADFAKIVESFDSKGVSFVSVTQQFNTTSSMGRLTLNVLLSFAQFEREVTGERIRDKIAASKKKGMWMGGIIPLGYDLDNRRLIVNQQEANTVRMIFDRYLNLGTVVGLQEELESNGVRSKERVTRAGKTIGGTVLCRGTLYHLLSNPVYIGKTRHKGLLHQGQHEPILDMETWKRAEALLKENSVVRRNHRNLSSGRMLHGLLKTAEGQQYTPTHCSKGGRRYFYYTLTSKDTPIKEYPLRRLPSGEIESRVLSSVSAFFNDSIRVRDQFPSLSVREAKLITTAARHQSSLLLNGAANEVATLVSRIVSKIIVDTSEIRIELRASSVAGELLHQRAGTPSTDIIELREPYQLARRGSEVRLILANNPSQRHEPIPALVRAVCQARTWYEWIVRGEIRTMRELSKRSGLERRYASRILSLAALSPWLTDAIMKGEHAPSLTVARLTEPIELIWERQTLPS
jgi:site-specific DNA recombinase